MGNYTTHSQSTLVFDVETTGTDPRRDQVIEICVQLGLDADAPRRTWRIRPSVDITPGAQAVHGIGPEALVGCPGFDVYAGDLRAIFDAAEVVVGYNVGFDIEMLQAEYERLGQPRLDLEGKKIIDAYRLWQRHEPRSLDAAHRRFVGDSFEEPHSATADVAATSRVLRGMIEAFGLEGRDWTAIARISEPEVSKWVGPTGHVRWGKDGAPVLAFGRYRGTPLHVLAAHEGGAYLRDLLCGRVDGEGELPGHVREICDKSLELDPDGFHRWVLDTYGRHGRAATAA